ncbi:hypothetical protein [Amycolatopsis granulosa]|uniref:hypothetical protein n=1 Tax=Amycolatopsis granulosa TaxID=185684 RepID=UPI0014239CFC|nr:hypothetical protein [Amycolatopsis granulosa]NIH87017.1 hypothetical protein [Amycolatopsis granulosa]
MKEGDRAPTIGPTIGAGLTAVGGAGYHFDPDQIAELIPKWEELVNDLDSDFIALRLALQSANPPSADEPAAANAQAIRASLETATLHNRQMRQYADEWIRTLRKANGTYGNQEDRTGRGLHDSRADTSGNGLYR